MWLAPLLACTDYGFSTSAEKDGLASEADTAGVTSTYGVIGGPDDEDSGPDDEDSGDEDSGEVPEEEGGDPCYEPEDGYDLNPAARVVTDDATEPVTVTFVGSDTSYTDELWIHSPVTQHLFDAWTATPGASTQLGPYDAGTELIFAAFVHNTGNTWFTGPASRNGDGVVHGATTYEGNCSWIVGFEDLPGGGDLDFNDVIFRVQGPLRQED